MSKFEFYVLNYDHSAKKVVNFNIFQNSVLQQRTEELLEQYYNKQIDYDTFKEQLLKNIKWQEWSRYEYEISVGMAFEEDCSKLDKWDCYAQAEPNIELIADMCIKRYYAELVNKVRDVSPADM